MLGVNTNVASIIAQNAAGNTQNSLQTAIQRLSTGLRINSAEDDPAGLSIATRMTAQVNGLNQAVLNANFGISLAQTAGGALSAATNALQTVRQLAVESANASNTSVDRNSLDAEVQQLIAQVQTIATQTQFNGQNVLDGTFGTAAFQVGANANQTISANLGNIQTSVLGNYSETGSAAVAAAIAGGGDLVINGVTVGASASAQANDVATAINAVSGQSNVTATATTTVVGTGAVTAATPLVAGSILINGTDIGAVAAGAAASPLSEATNIVNAINAKTNTTGVTASTSATGIITLTNSNGADVVITGTDAGTVSKLANATTHGTLTLSSASNFTVSGSVAANLGLATPTPTLSALNKLSVATVAGANTAISTVDGALAQINSLQANIGAVETRFQSVVSSLQTASQNLTSARSSVQDADFAAETANLSKAQILQQAGTAMIAQANSIPSQVLTLLKNA